ncbi:MAG: hypothetical protein J6B45_03990 [Clostridia bacterium]|nr:hypothetical protein [Clostridia bacterium]
MKKFFALLLAALMLLPCIVACGKTNDDPVDSSESSKQQQDNTDPSTKPSTGTSNSDKPGSGSSDNSSTEGSKPGDETPPSGSTGSSTGGSTGTTDTTVPSGSTGSSTGGSGVDPKPPQPDIYPEVVTKWEGSTLNILATIWTGEAPSAPWSQVELTVGENDWNSTAGFGVIINSAVLRRAQEIKDTYGVELNWINARGSQIANIISEAIVSGAGTKYHIAMPRMMEAQTIVSGNSIYDLANREYINLSNSYYSQTAVESYTVYDHTLFAAGDFSFLDEQTSYLIYYNVAMTTGFEAFPDLYQLVKDGKWTIDQMTNVAKLVKKNEGDPNWTDDDTYGFGTTNMSRFFQYSGIKQVSVGESKYGGMEYKLSLDDPKVGTLIDKILTITGADWARTSWDGDYTALQAAFTEGRLLFYNEVIQKSDYFAQQTDEFKVGLLPCPKLSESQDTYYTPCSYQSVVMCIPKATPDREMSDYFFEILSYTGQKFIMSAYKENLRTKLDPETAADSMHIIEEYIFKNLCYDQGYMYGWNGLLSSVQNESYASGKNNFTSEYTDAAEEALATLANWNLAWYDYTE